MWLEQLNEEHTADRVDETAAALLLFLEENKQIRSIKWMNERLNWQEHVRRELHTGTFDSKYHMPFHSFVKLVNMIRPKITLDFIKSSNSSRGNVPIYPELIVGMSLRFLGGEVVKSLEDIYRVDQSHVPKLINKFFDAIVESHELAIRLPQTLDEFKVLAHGFSSISGSDGLFDGCIGAIDGWLCQTVQPRDVQNKRDFFSGHYQCFGLNIQAICNHKLRFIYFAVAAPGKTGDARAMNKCVNLCKWVENKLKGSCYFLVGDNAYVLCDELLIPFSRNNVSEAKRTYNFYLLQVRIRIEMAFGQLTTKWRIFRTKLESGSKRSSMICRVAAILHNYVLNETDVNEREEGFVDPLPGSTVGYLPIRGDDEDDEGNNMIQGASAGTSRRRTAFVRIVQRDGMARPMHNILRNNE